MAEDGAWRARHMMVHSRGLGQVPALGRAGWHARPGVLGVPAYDLSGGGSRLGVPGRACSAAGAL